MNKNKRRFISAMLAVSLVISLTTVGAPGKASVSAESENVISSIPPANAAGISETASEDSISDSTAPSVPSPEPSPSASASYEPSSEPSSFPVTSEYVLYSGLNKNSDFTGSTVISVPASPGAEYRVNISGQNPAALKAASAAAVNADSVRVGFVAAQGVTEGTVSVEILQVVPVRKVSEKAVPATSAASGSEQEKEKSTQAEPEADVIFRKAAVLNIRFVTFSRTQSLSLKNGESSIFASPGKKTAVRLSLSKPTEAWSPEDVSKVTIKDKKIVSSVKIGGKYGSRLSVKVPKKAEKGTFTTIKIYSGEKTLNIKVYVRNKALKVTAKKKNIKLKLNKTGKIKFKIKAENPKRIAADELIAGWSNPEIAIAKKVVMKKGKLTVKVKGLKKGKTKFRLHVGKKKSVYIKVRVK